MRMKRRSFLAGSAGLVVITPGNVTFGVAEAINVVDRFGFRPDGRTDNYRPFRNLADFATSQGGGRFYFPPGQYYVEQIRTTNAFQRKAFQESAPGDVTNAAYIGCDGLEIIGDRASIILNGAFHRSAKRLPTGVAEGMYAAIFMPFEFRRCRNVVLSGFDIDGGVLKMTRDPSVAETYAYLVAVNGCNGVSLRDLELHHCQTDAILISDDSMLSGRRGVVSRGVSLARVICRDNARGGLAPLQVNGLTCIGSAFNGNGFGTGAYARHAPGFGVDVEPDRHLPTAVDSPTGNLSFERCDFFDNFSAFLAAYTWKYEGHLRLIDCRSRNYHNAPNHMIISWPGAIIEGGEHNIGGGTLWTCWNRAKGASLTLRNTKLSGHGHFGIFHAFPGNQVILDGVELTGTHIAPTFGAFPAIQANPGRGLKNVVRKSRFFIPRGRKSPALPLETVPSFNHTVCEGNVFATDLPAGDGDRAFMIDYGPGTIVIGDSFQGAAPGPADTIRPHTKQAHDTTQPYSRMAETNPTLDVLESIRNAIGLP